MAKRMDKRSEVEQAIDEVKEAKDGAASKLSGAEYKEFLDGLMAEVEGWRMELEELEGEDGEASE